MQIFFFRMMSWGDFKMILYSLIICFMLTSGCCTFRWTSGRAGAWEPQAGSIQTLLSLWCPVAWTGTLYRSFCCTGFYYRLKQEVCFFPLPVAWSGTGNPLSSFFCFSLGCFCLFLLVLFCMNYFQLGVFCLFFFPFIHPGSQQGLS